ncbi:MAG TPA: hypothetical protein VF188_05095 [Longimicrobiales bacterium]
MSESMPARGIVLAHGTLAQGLLDAVRRITGVEGALVAVSNEGLAPEALVREIERHIGGATTILFTDLPSGSCSFAARRLCRDRPELTVISGVNLPLLLDFVMHRQLPPEELIPRLLDKGRAGIDCPSGALEGHGHRAVPGR